MAMHALIAREITGADPEGLARTGELSDGKGTGSGEGLCLKAGRSLINDSSLKTGGKNVLDPPIGRSPHRPSLDMQWIWTEKCSCANRSSLVILQ